MRPRQHGVACRVGARHRQRRAAQIGADAAGVRQFGEQRDQQRARSGAEIGDAKRARARPVAIQRIERCFDHGLGFRAGHQRGAVDLKRQPPELLDPDDARHRFAGKPARRQHRKRARFCVGKPAGVFDRKPGLVERQRVAGQHARIELGAIEAGLAELARERAARLRNADGRRQRRNLCMDAIIRPRRPAVRPGARSPAR